MAYKCVEMFYDSEYFCFSALKGFHSWMRPVTAAEAFPIQDFCFSADYHN